MEKVDVEQKGSYVFQFVFIWEKKKTGLLASIVPFLKNKPEGKPQGSWMIILMT